MWTDKRSTLLPRDETAETLVTSHDTTSVGPSIRESASSAHSRIPSTSSTDAAETETEPEAFTRMLPSSNLATAHLGLRTVSKQAYPSRTPMSTLRERRPDAIIVQLLRDSQVYDTVTLNAGNNWRHTWVGLDDAFNWRVVEYETPEGYTVTVEREGITFVMTNSQIEEIPDEQTPEGGRPPGENTPPLENIPDEPIPMGPSLPVMSEWSYPKLKTAPCRYAGTAYKGGFVIAGHNYRRHFGPLKSLAPGDRVTFTDADGNLFAYDVAEIQVLKPTAIGDMVSEEWALSLFTCTLGGQTRLTVRCEACEE